MERVEERIDDGLHLHTTCLFHLYLVYIPTRDTGQRSVERVDMKQSAGAGVGVGWTTLGRTSIVADTLGFAFALAT